VEPSAAQAQPSHAHLWDYLHTSSLAVNAISTDDADVLLVVLCSSTQRTCMIMNVWTQRLA